MDAIFGIFGETRATSHFVSHFVKMGGGSRLLEIPPPILATSHFKTGAPYSRRCVTVCGGSACLASEAI